MKLAALCAQAARDPVLFLPRIESHGLGMALGLGSAAVGFGLSQSEWAGREAGAWVALAGVLTGMLLHWRWKRADSGWQIDFAQRRVAEVGGRAEAETISGDGWTIQAAPGERRTAVAIDLRHEDRGRVARLFETPARNKAAARQLSELADTLALRLHITRTGPRL